MRSIGERFDSSPQEQPGPASAESQSPVGDSQRLALFEAIEETELGWFWATDAEHLLTYLSPPAVRKFGDVEVIGQGIASLTETVPEEGDERSIRPLSFLLSSRNRLVDTLVKIETDKGVMFWSLTGKPQFTSEQDFTGYYGTAMDVTDSHEKHRAASRMAEYDSLTGLANRHRMSKRLAAALTGSKAAKRSCALIMLDLDRFKQVNDTLGHPAGDELLKQVSQRLQRILPDKAEIGRLGGDEFEIILPDMDDRGDLGELANRIIQMISQPYSIEGARAIIGTSVGIAIAPYDGVEPDELIKAVDLALYAAKGGGRGHYRFYTNELLELAKSRRDIEEDLRDALVRGELEVYYQPVIKANTQEVCGFEALMRWNHAEQGMISPAVFIPIAEEANLISPLGEWALMQACKDAAEWQDGLRVAVNVSAHQFQSKDLPALVTRALSSSGLSPERLELEITESVFMGDADETAAMFRRLKKIGVKLSLDDFGTGYSSLGYLRNAPFDKIKIDQSFVRGCTEKDNSNAAIITAIVSLARALEMETTAEGVEALDELALITGLGATNIQGFVFSRAVSQADLLAKLEAGGLRYETVGPPKHRPERRSVYRRVGIIHGDHHYEVMLRNLSRSGAMIEGLLNVPAGTSLVMDLGEGQLVVAKVRRSKEAVQGIEFEIPLIKNGTDGLCTRHRISPYALAAAGMPLGALPAGHYSLPGQKNGTDSAATFMQIDLSNGPGGAA